PIAIMAIWRGISFRFRPSSVAGGAAVTMPANHTCPANRRSRRSACENRDLAPAARSDYATIVSTAVVAYAAADVVHELCGHALVATLVGARVLSISEVAL